MSSHILTNVYFLRFFRVLSSIGWPALCMWPATLPTCQQLARPTCQWKVTASPWPDSCAAASLVCPTSSTRPRSGPTWATWTQSSGRRLTDSSETFPSRRSSTKSTKLFSKISSRTRSMTHQSWTDQGNKSKPTTATTTKPTKAYLNGTSTLQNWQKTKAYQITNTLTACSLKAEASAEVKTPSSPCSPMSTYLLWSHTTTNEADAMVNEALILNH